jgi:periplasmic divalent cation tolerance protein
MSATSNASRVRLVMVTAAGEEQAAAIARMLVSERLAACVNIIGPLRSIYRWKGALHDESEHLMLIKTRASLLGKLKRRVRELHSYEVPEVIAFAPADASAPYLKWLLEATAPVKPRARR